MAVLVDPPRWPAHGREWSHLVSDVSLEELHAFARRVGIPERGFEGDHYDVPAERLADLLDAGARLVPAAELLRRLVESDLRVPKSRGQRVLGSWLELRLDGASVHVDLVASTRAPPAPTTRGVRGLVLDDERRLLLRRPAGSPDDRWALPVVRRGSGRALGFTRHRPRAGASGGRRAPASRWRHLALVDAAPSEVVVGEGDELRSVPVTGAAQACGSPAWWPLVVSSLEAVAAARR